MTAIDEGGRAFPIDGGKQGMSLRDYFAANAMGALLGPIIAQKDIDPDFNFIADQAYSLADEMLKKRVPR